MMNRDCVYDATVLSFSLNPKSTINPVSTSLYIPSSNVLPHLNWNNEQSRYRWHLRSDNRASDDDSSRNKPSTLKQFVQFLLAFVKRYPHLLLLLIGWILWRLLYLEKRNRRRDVVDLALEQRFDWSWVRKNLTLKDL